MSEIPAELNSKPKQDRIAVTVIFNLLFETVTNDQLRELVRSLAALSQVDPKAIKLLQVIPGNLHLYLEMPAIAVSRLQEFHHNQDSRLQSLGVTAIILETEEPAPLLRVSGIRAIARAISRQVITEVAPQEAVSTIGFVDPLLDMTAAGQYIVAGSSNQQGALGSGDMLVAVVVPAVVTVLSNLLAHWGARSWKELQQRVAGPDEIIIRMADIELIIKETNSTSGRRNKDALLRAITTALHTELNREPASASKRFGGDIFTGYQRALDDMLYQLGATHSRYLDVLLYQARLAENISQTRRYGNTDERSADRSQIIEQLNVIAMSELGFSFNQLV
jgi:hypothetical protein